MDGSSATKINVSPFDAVEAALRVDNADCWEQRSYLVQSLAGLLHTIVTVAEQSELTSAVAYLPGELRQKMNWWPDEADGSFIHWKDGRWQAVPAESTDDLPVEAPDPWLVCTGKEGSLVVCTRPDENSPRRRPLSLDLWDVQITWHAAVVGDALAALAGSFRKDSQAWTMLQEVTEDVNPASARMQAELRAALSLADHFDPRSRADQIERNWVEVFNTVQFEVAWQLYSDRLLPSIGRALERALGYDFIDIHVFNRLGSRYEEFLSWQDNRTGFGKDLNIFVDKKVVKQVLEGGRPRLIKMAKEDGVLNPHLAELAGMSEGLLMPLVHDHKVQGMIAMYYAEPTGLMDSDLSRVGRIGHIIARSIENSNAHEDMRLMASVDALTGLANRRSFNEVIEKESHRSARYRLPLSLVLIDIDFFKKYNDSNGHLKGDYLLRDFSSILRKMVREEDTVARYGGEEFAIVLPHTKADNAYAAAEKIRKRVADTVFQDMESQPDGRITISLGVADTDGSLEDHRDLIDRADKALYRAKETGRNRTVKYSVKLASHGV